MRINLIYRRKADNADLLKNILEYEKNEFFGEKRRAVKNFNSFVLRITVKEKGWKRNCCEFVTIN